MKLALLTTKTYQNGQLRCPQWRRWLAQETTVLCLQNGIDSYVGVAKRLGQDRVMPGCVYIEAGMRGARRGAAGRRRGPRGVRRG